MRALLTLPLALFVAACGAPAPKTNAAPLPDAPAGEVTVSAPLDLLDYTALAAGEFERAGFGAVTVDLEGAARYDVSVHWHDGPMADCGTEPGVLAIGCTDYALFRGDTTYVHIDSTIPEQWVRQVVAHELGHALGLKHSAPGTGDVMDPTRDLAGPVRMPSP